MTTNRVVVLVSILLACSRELSAQLPSELPMALETGGHTGAVTAMEFTPDGSRLVTVASDLSMRWWDTRTPATAIQPPRGENSNFPIPSDARAGRPLRTWFLPLANESQRLALSVSPEGNRLAVAGLAGSEERPVPTVFVLSMPSGRIERVMRGHNTPISALQFTSGGRNLISAGMTDGLIFWDVESGVRTIETKTEAAIGAFALSTKTNLVAAAAADGAVYLYEGSKGAVQSRIETGERPCRSVAFSPDGLTLATCGPTMVRRWTLEGKEIGEGLSMREQNPRMIRYSDDGKELLFAGARLGRLNLENRGETILAERPMAALAVAPQAGAIAAADAGDSSIHFFERGEKLPAKRGSQAQRITRVAFRDLPNALNKPNPALVWRAERDYQFNIRGLAVAPLTQPVEWAAPVRQLGGWVLAAGPDAQSRRARQGDRQLVLRPTFAGEQSLPQPQISSYVLLNEHVAALGTTAGRLHLFDLRDGRQTQVLTGHLSAVRDAVLSPDGRLLATGSDDRTLRVWRMNDAAGLGRPTPLLSIIEAGGEWAAWTPEGFYTASVGGERLAAWKIAAGAERLLEPVYLKQLQKRLFQPLVIANVLQGNTLSAAIETANMSDLRKPSALPIQMCDVRIGAQREKLLPPAIDWVRPQVGAAVADEALEIEIRVEPRGGASITSILVLVNGVREEIPKDGDYPRRLTYTVQLRTGSNRLSVIAIDDRGSYSESLPVEVLYRTKDAVIAPVPNNPTKPAGFGNLYIVAVGISLYDSPQLIQLCWAHRDAEEISNALQKQTPDPYAGVYPTVLRNDKASREEILVAIQAVINRAQKNDTVLLAFSAHGILHESSGFFLATTKADLANLQKDCLWWGVIVDAVRKLPSRKKIVLVDTCHALAVTGNLADSIHNPVRDLLDIHVGAVVFASSKDGKPSIEDAKWRHGAFTKGFLDTIHSPNSDNNGDQLISVSEVFDHLDRRVKDLTNESQVMAMYHHGENFDFLRAIPQIPAAVKKNP
jgi:WD40 repeat protein